MQENANGICSSTSPQPAKTIYLLDFLQTITRRSRLVFTFTAAAAVLAVVYTLFLPNIYTARTLIYPTQEDKGLMTAMMGQLGGLANLTGGLMGGPTNADLYVSMLKSQAVKDRIIDRFKLTEVYRKKYRADASAVLDKSAAISIGKKDGVITIAVDDRDPKRAAEMANAYVEELGKLAVRLNVTGAGQNRAFLDERLAAAKADLAKAEENLKAFQAKNKAFQVSAQAEATIKGAAEMRAQLAAQEVQLATYRRQFTESSQEVKNQIASVKNLRSQIARLEGSNGGGIMPSAGALPAIGQEYVRLMREFKIQESLVELLTKQHEMAALSEAKDVSPFQVIDEAKIPEKKSKPHRSLIVLLAVFTAFLCSVYGAFVLEQVESLTERDREQWRAMRSQLLFWRKQ